MQIGPLCFPPYGSKNTIDDLNKKNEYILAQIMTLDEKIKDIDEILTENDSLYLKLQQLENELEHFQPMEQTIYKKDCIIEELNKKK